MIKRGYIHFDCKNRGRRPEGNCFGYKKKQATSVGRRVSNLDQEFIANDLPSLDKTVRIFCLPLLLFAPLFFRCFKLDATDVFFRYQSDRHSTTWKLIGSETVILTIITSTGLFLTTFSLYGIKTRTSLSNLHTFRREKHLGQQPEQQVFRHMTDKRPVPSASL